MSYEKWIPADDTYTYIYAYMCSTWRRRTGHLPTLSIFTSSPVDFFTWPPDSRVEYEQQEAHAHASIHAYKIHSSLSLSLSPLPTHTVFFRSWRSWVADTCGVTLTWILGRAVTRWRWPSSFSSPIRARRIGLTESDKRLARSKKNR